MAAICKEWSLPSANDIVMVGDSVSNDIVFGKNAGSWTALLDIHGNQHPKEPKADFVVSDLTSLAGSLYRQFSFVKDNNNNNNNKDVSKGNPSLPPPQPTADFTQAAAGGDLQDIIEMSSSTFDIHNAVDDYGNTALIWAAEKGHEEIVQWLVDNNNNNKSGNILNRRGYTGSTALLPGCTTWTCPDD